MSSKIQRLIRSIISTLCFVIQTIRCPPDRVCRVILCRSCTYTDYLQAVCEYSKGIFHNLFPIIRTYFVRHLEPTLCDSEQQISILTDIESIAQWERQTLALVRRYANEKRQRLRSPWPVLTIN